MYVGETNESKNLTISQARGEKDPRIFTIELTVQPLQLKG